MLTALCCPDDRTPLELPSEPACPSCGREFDRSDGILRMLPALQPSADVLAERRQRDREALLYDRLLGLRLLTPLELPLLLGPLALRAGEKLVEVGCGTGRLSVPAVRTGAACVLLDHSLVSLRLLRAKLPPTETGLIQGDASRLPVRDGWADAVLSGQMLEHLPAPALREAAIREMRRVLQPGGRLALSAYQAVPFLPREGRHSGEIYFYRFTRGDLLQLLEPHFRIVRLTGTGYVWVVSARAT